MTKLYELTQQYREISKLLDYDYAEMLNVEDTLKSIEDEFDNKAISIAKIYKELKSSSEAIEQEIDRLKGKITTIDNNMNSIKKYLLTEMTDINRTEIKDNLISVKIQKVRPSVEIINLNEISGKFIKIIPEEKQPLKNAILEHFGKTGEIPSGVNIITDKKMIVIR